MPRTAANKGSGAKTVPAAAPKPAIRKLSRVGGSLGVTLPAKMLDRLGAEMGDHVRIDYDPEGDRIIITAVQL